MGLPFLTAMRPRPSTPASVCVLRDYTVTYVLGVCSCPEHHKTKVVTALSRQEARRQFEKDAPLAWVLRVD